IYAVTNYFTLPTHSLANSYSKTIRLQLQGEIEAVVRDDNSKKDNPLAYILIATNNTTPTTKDLSAEEKVNFDSTLTFYDLPFSENEEHLFRHNVSWSTIQRLSHQYGQSVTNSAVIINNGSNSSNDTAPLPSNTANENHQVTSTVAHEFSDPTSVQNEINTN